MPTFYENKLNLNYKDLVKSFPNSVSKVELRNHLVTLEVKILKTRYIQSGAFRIANNTQAILNEAKLNVAAKIEMQFSQLKTQIEVEQNRVLTHIETLGNIIGSKLSSKNLKDDVNAYIIAQLTRQALPSFGLTMPALMHYIEVELNNPKSAIAQFSELLQSKLKGKDLTPKKTLEILESEFRVNHLNLPENENLRSAWEAMETLATLFDPINDHIAHEYMHYKMRQLFARTNKHSDILNEIQSLKEKVLRESHPTPVALYKGLAQIRSAHQLKLKGYQKDSELLHLINEEMQLLEKYFPAVILESPKIIAITSYETILNQHLQKQILTADKQETTSVRKSNSKAFS